MAQIKTTRIESIDILRGVVMVIMALDHVRDFFHIGAFTSDPTNLDTTTPFLFFTRFITHYCAPVFVFLAGTSAFLYSTKKTKPEVFKFLLTRGIWLILLEIVLNNLLWWFDLTYSFMVLQVIWAIGLSMIFLSFLIYLPIRVILIIGILLVAGHNTLDGITVQGTSFDSIVWYILHQQQFLPINSSRVLVFAYPIIPWIGVMALGFCFGSFYKKGFKAAVRKKWLAILGISSIVLFFVLRGLNMYGDLVPWSTQDTTTKTILSFFNVTKYPPSLAYVLITIGPSLLFLYGVETVKNKISDFFLVFGRVPLFYYFLHVFTIHILAIAGLVIFGGNWRDLILSSNAFSNPNLANYGYSLFVVYLVWIGVIALLYFPSKKYMIYKANNKDTWWLSYL
ncbi:heparan-alpha-glucosaminide N-acetyltransferase domain-containing protein [Flavivirga amylovorans]|uniref:Heparan-alpha-glucosaminide N-acetyltransferase domain-containing protein n=1 Tax=Flavivirga amylovorans TaxID=870486 RepID=A0ABT8X6A6_9FLAO|nr:heparan-alpha-glucosaminide N-acetyltransferase domain-containing protein [Flavivirga amylovorans]MDO5989421.1 heparan-alpha-glucosaminide N-acetyltransferase domain-containing protein [Flavivirga amylovorans]